MPRRLKVLLGVFFSLVAIWGGWYAVHVRQERQREVRVQEMMAHAAERNQSQANVLSEIKAPATAPAAKIVTGRHAIVELVRLVWKPADGEGRVLSSFDGLTPIAPDSDLIAVGNELFVIKEPGRVERLWPKGSNSDPLHGVYMPFSGQRVCFDGRYVWLCEGAWGDRRLMVIDTLSDRSWEFANEQTGLFPRSGGAIQVGLAGVRPGVVGILLVAGDSTGRSSLSSLSVLRFDPESEEREVEPINLPSSTGFISAEQMFALEAKVDNETVRRIVIVRPTLPRMMLDPETHDESRDLPPGGRGIIPYLLLDPESGTISEAAPNSLSIAQRTGHWCVNQGTVWWQTKRAGTDERTTLMRATLPDLKEEAVLSQVPSAFLAPHDDSLFLLGSDCWHWKGSSAEIGLVNTEGCWTFDDRLVPPAEAPSIGPPGGVMIRFKRPPPADQPVALDDLFGAPSAAGRKRSAFQPVALYRSSVYGLLMTASYYSEDPLRIFRIALEDASAEEPGDRPGPPAADRQRPPPIESRLTLAAATEGSSPELPPLAMLDAAVEPVYVSLHQRLPVLAREVVRQSLLLAAWAELDCAIGDGALGEALADSAQTRAKYRLSSWFLDDGRSEVALDAVSEAGELEPLWQQRLALSSGEAFDYLKLVEAAETWSRQEFPARLRSSLPQKAVARHEVDPLDKVDAGVERQLGEMTFPAQFTAVRRCSRTLSRGGDAEHWLGNLARGYANLGLLTEHHWSLVHKTFQARSLLLAQRLVARQPKSPWGLWHRAYALCLAGLPTAALDDLAQAEKLAAGEGVARQEMPAWVAVIAAACRGDEPQLGTLSQQELVGSLAALLRFLGLARLQGTVLVMNVVRQENERFGTWHWNMRGSVLTTRAAASILQREPECFRAYDAMSDCCDPGELRDSTAKALDLFEQRFAERLRAMPGLPASVAERLDSLAEQGNLTERLSETLLRATEIDATGLSWQALGMLARDTLFMQCWRRAHCLRFEANERADKFLAEAAPRVAHHPFRRLFDFYADRDNDDMARRANQRQKSAAAELAAQFNLATLTDNQWRLFVMFFYRTLSLQRPDECTAAVTRVTEHDDDVLRDLLERNDLRKKVRQLPVVPHDLDVGYSLGPPWAVDTARQINAINPGNPDAVAAAVRANRALTERLFEELLKKYPRQPQVLRAMALSLCYPNPDRRCYDVLAEYVKLSPDAWAYLMLARHHFNEGRLDQWQAVLDEYLVQAGDDATATATRVAMVHYLCQQGEMQKALPYALAAAATQDLLGIGAAVRCYENLGDEEQEGIWRQRLFDADSKSYNAREIYFWCRRTRRGEANVWVDRTLSLIRPNDLYARDATQTRFGAFYWLAGQRDAALQTYQLGTRMAPDPVSGVFCNLCAALVAEEMGDEAARDIALAQGMAVHKPPLPNYEKLARWMSKGFPNKKLDLEAAEEFLVGVPPKEKTALNFLTGYALLLVGRTEAAATFLKRAATIEEGVGSTSRLMAIVALREGRLSPMK